MVYLFRTTRKDSMSNYQKLFNGLMAILKKNEATHPLAQKCFKDCENELAFTPPNPKSAASKQMVLEILKHSDEEAYAQLLPMFIGSAVDSILIWHIDTENGNYTIYTDVDMQQLVGIKHSKKTLTDIRRNYFIQKEAVQKLGDDPVYSYDEKEITFIKKKLLT
jgi:hypothetical protein